MYQQHVLNILTVQLPNSTFYNIKINYFSFFSINQLFVCLHLQSSCYRFLNTFNILLLHHQIIKKTARPAAITLQSNRWYLYITINI